MEKATDCVRCIDVKKRLQAQCLYDSVYRNTMPATPAPKAGRCGNINSVDQLRHPRSDAYSAELVLLPHRPAGCILGAGAAGVVFLYTSITVSQYWRY